MKKAFTLVELLVTIAIVAIITAIAIPGLASQKNRAKNLETATSVSKDAILATQNYAFAPTDVNAQYYVLEMKDFGSDPKYYVYWTDDPGDYDKYILKEEIPLYGNIDFSSEIPTQDNFVVGFHVGDGVPWFWDGGSALIPPNFPEEYAKLKLVDSKGNTKYVVVQKNTGETHVE